MIPLKVITFNYGPAYWTQHLEVYNHKMPRAHKSKLNVFETRLHVSKHNIKVVLVNWVKCHII